MKLVLSRIDDRLVHGQVVVGCCDSIHVERIVLINDQAASDSLQARLYRAAVPPEIEAEVLDLNSGIERLGTLESEGDTVPTLLVVESPADMRRLVEAGAPIQNVNLGGMHHRAGTREIWSGYFVSDEDITDLRALIDAGIDLQFQTVPGAPSADAARLLERA